MILGIGTDVVNIGRIEKLLQDFTERFEERIFTPAEIDYANQRGKADAQAKAATLAKRFAAKEAFVKAIGSGFADGISWKEVEVLNQPSGKPYIEVKGAALAKLQAISPRGIMPQIDVSLADDYPLAQAFVVISFK